MKSCRTFNSLNTIRIHVNEFSFLIRMGTEFGIVSVFFLVTSLFDFHVYSCDTNCTDPPVITPARLVVKYGDPVIVSCSVCPNCTDRYLVYGFVKPLGNITKNGNIILWEAEKMTEWNPAAFCHYFLKSGDQTVTALSITVYKPPDEVSFSFVNHIGSMIENRPYTLQCEVQNVAPVENLTVTFYRGQTPLIQLQSNQRGEKPVNETFHHNITSTKDDDGAQFWCEAKLELGPYGPQPPAMMSSHKATVSVHSDILIYIIIGVVASIVIIIFVAVPTYRCYKKSRKGRYNLTIKEVIRLRKAKKHVEMCSDSLDWSSCSVINCNVYDAEPHQHLTLATD